MRPLISRGIKTSRAEREAMDKAGSHWRPGSRAPLDAANLTSPRPILRDVSARRSRRKPEAAAALTSEGSHGRQPVMIIRAIRLSRQPKENTSGILRRVISNQDTGNSQRL